jgi:predicted metal-dependent hydrolase
MSTPADAAIHPRDLNFRCEAAASRWWMGNDPVATAYYNAFSASFPQAERYFVECVRRFRDQAPAILQKQIAGFIAQESMHSREHAAFNRDAICRGYDLARIDALLRRRFEWLRTLDPMTQAGVTAALEHFTTILAREAIGNPRHLEKAPEEIRRLWCWHAAEEIEHKAVAFDTFLLAARALSPFARWLVRLRIMAAATFYLFDFMLRGVAEFFRQDSILTIRTWVRFLKFAFVSPGVIRRILGRYLLWYLPGFHPWWSDDRALVAQAEDMIALPV